MTLIPVEKISETIEETNGIKTVSCYAKIRIGDFFVGLSNDEIEKIMSDFSLFQEHMNNLEAFIKVKEIKE